MLYIPTTGDYLLRENFSSSKLKFLKHDIPLMALTATTIPLREGIIKSLKIFVSTSFFRPNLRFSVSYCNYPVF
jgi:Werner syndrome ATP-dependent helicase